MSTEIPRPDIILARHAHSEGNAGKRTSGFAEIALTEDGHRQAETLAKQVIDRFGVNAIGRIITTPYVRTQQTAAPLIQRVGLEPLVMPGMREITYLQPSNADGKTFDERRELRDVFWAATKLNLDYVDEGELPLDSARSFVKRIHDSLDELAVIVEEDPRLHVVYSHEFPVATALNIARGKSDDEIIATMIEHQKVVPAIDNTQAVGLTYKNGKWTLAHNSHTDLFQSSRRYTL